MTERVKLWDKFTAPVDQEAIKLEFFRKIQRKNPPFRIKVRLPPRNRVLVPPMVKDHYRKPVQLLPSLRDVLRLETVCGRYNDVEYVPEDLKEEEEPEEDACDMQIVSSFKEQVQTGSLEPDKCKMNGTLAETKEKQHEGAELKNHVLNGLSSVKTCTITDSNGVADIGLFDGVKNDSDSACAEDIVPNGLLKVDSELFNGGGMENVKQEPCFVTDIGIEGELQRRVLETTNIHLNSSVIITLTIKIHI